MLGTWKEEPGRQWDGYRGKQIPRYIAKFPYGTRVVYWKNRQNILGSFTKIEIPS